MAETVYTPIINAGSVEDALRQIELKKIPPYPDDGVMYAQFAKAYLGNDYKLLRQVKKNFFEAHVISGTTIGRDISLTIPEGYKYFITQISISFSWTTTTQWTLLNGDTTSNERILQAVLGNDRLNYFNFTIPIECLSSTLHISTSGGIPLTGFYEVNIYGWLEEIP